VTFSAGGLAELTLERPAPGVVVAQPARGFRFGAEAFWLAGAAMALAPRTALDLGTGSGIVAQLLSARGVEATGVDRWPAWATAWASSSGGARLLQADVVGLQHAPVDVVVCNPPFFRAGDGPRATDPWKAVARTESTATLADFVAAAARCLTPVGTLIFVVPTDRAADLAAALPTALGVRSWVAVGARRTMVWASRGASSEHRAQISDSGDEVRGWYHAVGARFRDEGGG
jgi:tRNA1(Val) A37 N6-methylase TrmN6